VAKIYSVSLTVATIARNAAAAILFGGDGVLINNIAWLLRRLPVFAVGGTGAYRIRPVHIDDLARLCLAAGRRLLYLPAEGAVALA
jgi:nucleoside-diphosphate-sugar epimerase